MNPKVLFIHGFGSCGTGDKARALADHFGAENLVAPDLPVDPHAACAVLQDVLARESIDLLVGSSLGGFYAIWLNGLRPAPTVLINPAVKPWATLAPHVGIHNHWCTGEPFELKQAHVDRLETLARLPDKRRERYLVLLARHDEILDYREAAEMLRAFDVLIEEDDNHRFKRLAQYLPAMDRFRAIAPPEGMS